MLSLRKLTWKYFLSNDYTVWKYLPKRAKLYGSVPTTKYTKLNGFCLYVVIYYMFRVYILFR